MHPQILITYSHDVNTAMRRGKITSDKQVKTVPYQKADLPFFIHNFLSVCTHFLTLVLIVGQLQSCCSRLWAIVAPVVGAAHFGCGSKVEQTGWVVELASPLYLMSNSGSLQRLQRMRDTARSSRRPGQRLNGVSVFTSGAVFSRLPCRAARQAHITTAWVNSFTGKARMVS